MGICRGGKSLRELIGERDQLFRETGHVWGLERLELMDSEPLKFDRLQWKLVAAGCAARETSKFISASPAAVSMGELLDLVALPDGDVVAASSGLQAHVGCVPMIVRSIAELGYEDDAGMGGIKDGDIFHCSDPLYGAPHAADNYTLVPIFYKGELIAWACGINHVADVGGTLAAGSSPPSPTTYFDGFIVPPTKTGQNFAQSKWWERQLMRRTRTGVLNILDDKMRVAGALMLRERLLEIVEEFGVDYFERALREIVERERRDIANRIRSEMVPGRYSGSYFRNQRFEMLESAFAEATGGYLLHLHNEITITPQATIKCDFSGSSSEGYHNLNVYPGAHGYGKWANLQIFLVQSPLCNTAMQYVVLHEAPCGSILNPRRTDLGSSLGLTTATFVNVIAESAIAMSRFARGFLEEAYTRGGSYSAYSVEGTFANGSPWGMGEFSMVGDMPVGASAWRDGFPHGTGPGNPQGDSGETEEWEFVMPPLLTIGKRHVRDFFCHGRFRGSIGLCLTHLVNDPGQSLSFQNNVSGNAAGGPAASGMCGGYPIAPNYSAVFHNTNARELIQKGIPLPADFVEIWEYIERGTLKVESIEEYRGDLHKAVLRDGDIITQAAQANSAWGDPLDRDPKLVEADLNGDTKEDNNVGWISAEVAKKAYGVVADLDGRWKVNDAKTAKARAALRQERLQKSVPVEEWWPRERESLLRKELPELTRAMYADCLGYEAFRRHFTRFWQLPEDFKI